MKSKDQILLEQAYEKVLAEKKQRWTKGSEYAICTASVGRKDEAKYKSCKKKVKAAHKKSVSKKK
jgi:hypothetical protein